VAASWVWAGIGTFVVLKITGIFVPLRVDEKQEEVGLDVSQHGEPAYGI
jgi:Amt family ammonium transporter